MNAQILVELFEKLDPAQKWLAKKAIFGISQPKESWAELCRPMREYARKERLAEEEVLRIVMDDRYGSKT